MEVDEFRIIRKIAGQVSIPDLKPSQIHLGETYRDSEEWWAAELRNSGATFAWIAYSFGGLPMWELHAGAVLTPQGAQVGLHCHKHARKECIDAFGNVGRQFGEVYDGRAANELQYNQVFMGHDDDQLSRIAGRLSNIYISARDGLNKQSLLLI